MTDLQLLDKLAAKLDISTRGPMKLREDVEDWFQQKSKEPKGPPKRHISELTERSIKGAKKLLGNLHRELDRVAGALNKHRDEQQSALAWSAIDATLKAGVDAISKGAIPDHTAWAGKDARKGHIVQATDDAKHYLSMLSDLLSQHAKHLKDYYAKQPDVDKLIWAAYVASIKQGAKAIAEEHVAPVGSWELQPSEVAAPLVAAQVVATEREPMSSKDIARELIKIADRLVEGGKSSFDGVTESSFGIEFGGGLGSYKDLAEIMLFVKHVSNMGSCFLLEGKIPTPYSALFVTKRKTSVSDATAAWAKHYRKAFGEPPPFTPTFTQIW